VTWGRVPGFACIRALAPSPSARPMESTAINSDPKEGAVGRESSCNRCFCWSVLVLGVVVTIVGLSGGIYMEVAKPTCDMVNTTNATGGVNGTKSVCDDAVNKLGETMVHLLGRVVLLSSAGVLLCFVLPSAYWLAGDSHRRRGKRELPTGGVGDAGGARKDERRTLLGGPDGHSPI
jgi:hypothetical protein